MFMKYKLLFTLAVSVFSIAYADCSFTYINKSHAPVTLQGYFLENGDQQSKDAWITVDPTRQVTQVRSGKKCNTVYKHSGQVDTRIDLKNSSGYWIGNKGFLFAADRSYSHYSGDRALADDGTKVTLSNAAKISGKEFKVVICQPDVDSDSCN